MDEEHDERYTKHGLKKQEEIVKEWLEDNDDLKN